MIDQVGARRTHSGGRPQKYVLDDRGRKLIEDRYDGTKERTDDLAKWIGVPPWIVRKWAYALEVAQKSELKWSQEEVDFLEKNLFEMSSEDISRHLGRTVQAVQAKMKRLGFRKTNPDGYTEKDLMLGFGITDHHKIGKWIERGWIKGKKLPTSEHEKRQPWLFTDRAVRNFIIAHPDELDQRKFDWLWIVDVLSGNGLGRLDEDKYGERTS